MKILHFTSGRWGFSFFDFLAVVFVVLLAAFLIVTNIHPHPHSSSLRVRRAQCINNQKQIGEVLNQWAHAEMRYPMGYSTKQGGSRDYLERGAVFRHFLLLSTRLDGPQLLVCPADDSRLSVSNWKSVKGNSNISYFVNIDAQAAPDGALSVLTGDRCITGGVSSAGLMLLTSNSPAGWAYNIHPEGGVIGLSDGTVQQATSEQLRKHIQANPMPIIRLAIP